MKSPLKVLSLFDGIACARVALERVGIPVEKYYASEIEKDAIKITQKNYPDIIQLGDVRNVIKEMVGKVDLIIGGSPCQDLSIAKSDRKGLKGERSSLFFEYVRLLEEIRPEYFILENVASMKRSDMWAMTRCLYDIFPTMIDAALVSAQHRERYFWIGKKTGDSYKKVWISQPSDRRIILKDILEKDVDEKYFSVNYNSKWHSDVPVNIMEEKYKTLRVGGSIPTIRLGQPYMFDTYNNTIVPGNKTKTLGTNPNCITAIAGQVIVFPNKSKRLGEINSGGQGERIYSVLGKSVALSANGGGWGAKTGLYLVGLIDGKNSQGKRVYSPNGKSTTIGAGSTAGGEGGRRTGLYLTEESTIRKLTPIECERLQGLPDNYTEGVSNTQRYKCLGNAFNVDVVAHILSELFKNLILRKEVK